MYAPSFGPCWPGEPSLLSMAARVGLVGLMLAGVGAGSTFEFDPPRVVGASVNASTHFWFPNSARVIGGTSIVEVTLRDDSCCFKPPLPASTVFLDSGRGFAKQWTVPDGGPEFCGQAGISVEDGSLLCRGNTTSLTHTTQAFSTQHFWLDMSSTRLRVTPSPFTQQFELPQTSVPMKIFRSESTVNMLEVPGTGSGGPGLLMRVETLCPRAATCANGLTGAFNALYVSSDGGAHWRHRSVIPKPPSVGGVSCEYPRVAETQLQLLHKGSPFGLMFIARCHPTPAAKWYEGSSFLKTASHDGGLTWTTVAKDDQVFAVAPKMQRLSDGRLLLVSGRPSIFLWLSADGTGSGSWSPISLVAAHNQGVRDSSLRYSKTLEQIEAGEDHELKYFGSEACQGDHGRWCTPQGNRSTFYCTAWCETTSYTSLLARGNDTFTVFYDRLASGWAGPPGVFGHEDHVFSMSFRLKSDDYSLEQVGGLRKRTVPPHVKIMTACGYNASIQAGWSSFGKSRDLQQLIDGYDMYGLRGMYRIDNPEYSSIACSKNHSLCMPWEAFGRGAICAFKNGSSHNGIRLCSKAAGDQTNWDEQTRKMVQLMRPHLLSGALVGISLGDEQVGSVPSENSYRLPFEDFEMWVNLARGLLDELTPQIRLRGHPAPLLYYMEGARVQLWPRIPHNLTHFSVCQYFPSWMYRSLWIKPLVQHHVFPKLGPNTSLLVVPPILASRTGFASPSIFCPNITYKQWLALDEGNMSFYTSWVFNDTRLVGFDPWPLAQNDPQPGALGLGQIPEMLDVFRPLGEAILRNGV